MTVFNYKVGSVSLYTHTFNGFTDVTSQSETVAAAGNSSDEEYTKVKTKNSSVVLDAPVNKRWSFVILVGLFSIALTILYITYRSFPQLQE